MTPLNHYHQESRWFFGAERFLFDFRIGKIRSPFRVVRCCAFASLVAAMLLVLAASASAQTNGTWTGANGATWDTSATNWSGVSGTPWDSSNGTTANATFNATSGSASVSGTVFANTITYSPVGGNFSIANGNITLAGTTPTINNYDPTGTLTLSSTVAGSAGLISRGVGTLVLAGNNTYTGTTTIKGGPLVLDYSGLSNTADPLSTGVVTLDMGTLTLKGKSSGSTSETISTLNMGANLGTANTLRLDSNGGSGIALTVSTFVMNTTAANVQNINLIDLSSSGSNSITVGAPGTGTAVANGVIMGNSNRANLVVRDSSGYGFATLSGTTLGRLSTGTTLDATNTSSTTNYRLTNAGTLTRAANLDYSTITLDSTAGAVTLDMGANNLAPSGNGRGILITGANDVSITGTGRLEGTASTWFHNYSTGTFTYGLSTSLTVSASLMFGGSGLTVWTGNSTKTSGTDNLYIEGGIFRPTAAQNWTTGSGVFTGGVWVSSGAVLEVGADLNGGTAGDLSNTIGNSAGSGHIRFWGNSGVSAFGANRTINFGGSGATLTWGSTSFLTDAGGTGDGNYAFKLSSNRSDSTVTVQNAIALGSLNRTVEVANGSAATDAILTGVLSGAGGLVKSGAGTLALHGTNTYTGSTTINAGTLSIAAITNGGVAGALGNSTNAAGSLVLGGGTLEYTGTANGTTNRDFTLTAGTTSGISVANSTVSLTISGNAAATTGGLTKSGAGTLTLNGTNTYTGATTINAGTLQIGAGSTTGSISSSSAITNNGTLLINRSDAITLSNTISGTGNLTKLGTNTLTLNGSSANTYNGTTTVSAGNLTLDKTSGVVAVGGDLVLNGSSKLLYGTSKNEQIANTASVTINGSQSVFNGSVWASATSGTIQSSITETIGSLTVRDGQFNTGTASNWTVTGAGVFDGSTGDTRFLGFSGSRISFNSLSLTAMTGITIINDSDSFVMGGGNTTAVTTLSVGSGGFTLNGSTLGLNKGTSASQLGSRLILDGNITTTGSSASSIASNNGGTFGSSDILLSSTAGSFTRTITTGSGADLTIGVAITNGNATTAGIIKDGLGTLTLSSNNTYNGATTVAGGTLLLTGNGTLGTSTVSISGGTLDMGGKSLTNTLGSLTGGTLSNGTLTNNGGNYDLQNGTVSAVLAGTNGVNKTGSGTVTLAGSNTYTGATTLNTGNISINTTAALASTSGLSLANATSLIYNGSAATLDRAISVTSGTGTIRNSGTGLLTLSGALSKNGTTLTLAGGSNGITVSGVISGSSANSDLIIDGGTTTLANANSYNGPTSIINGGTLNANFANALPTANLTAISIDATGTGSSTLALGANQQIASLTGAASSTVALGSNTITIGNTSGSTTYAGLITGGSSSALVKQGASIQVLTGNNTGFTGTTTITGGTLQAASVNALGSNNTVTVHGGTLLVSADDAINGMTVTLNSTSTTVAALAFSGNYSGSIGRLTLSANSIIDLGEGNVGLQFADMVMGFYNLSIYNWSGTTQWGTTYGPGTDRVYFNGNYTASNVKFYSGAVGSDSFIATGFDMGLQQTSWDPGLSGHYILPVPEPETWATGILLLLGGAWWMIKRTRKAA